MKLEIIEKPDYTLAVYDEEIQTEYYYNDLDKALRKGYVQQSYHTSVIAYRPKDNAPELDGLPLLPEMENDVEKLLDEKYPYEIGYSVSDENSTIQAMREAFTEGHKASTKTFSEEDLRKAFERGFSVATHLADYKTEEEWSKFINSLKQPKYFVAEMEKGYRTNCDGEPIGLPVHDIGLKTTTINGKTYLVGTNLYE